MRRDIETLLQWREVRHDGTLPPARLGALQNRRLGALIRHAGSEVPFYRRMFDRIGLSPAAIRTPDDLARLPLARRYDLRSVPEAERMARGVDPATCVTRRTGGSSGVPLAVVTRKRDFAHETLVWLRSWRRLGLRWSDLQVTIKEPGDVVLWDRPHWRHSLGFLRVRYLDIRRSPDQLARELADLEPDVLRAPPSILAAIAGELRPGHAVRPRLVFTTSERLDPEARRTLEAAFAAPIHDFYGATEAGCIAWRCPRCDAYHVNADSVLVEVVDSNGRPVRPGESGEVAITNLVSWAMPFIRYSLGDRAELGDPCSDAPGSVTLRSLLGRTHQHLVASDHSALSPYGFMPDEIPGIAEYRIVQEEPGRVRVLVVPGAGFEPTLLESARLRYQANLGRKCLVVFEVCESLPPASPLSAVIQTSDTTTTPGIEPNP